MLIYSNKHSRRSVTLYCFSRSSSSSPRSEREVSESRRDISTRTGTLIRYTVDRAFTDAYNLLASIDVNIALERKKKATINQVSSFIRGEFEKKFRRVAYEDEDDMPSVSSSGKSQFRGMRVFDTVSPASVGSYFRLEIDGKRKYTHKQTACWLLTDVKAELSADRLKRVQQTSR